MSKIFFIKTFIVFILSNLVIESAFARYLYNADYTIKSDTVTGIDYPRTSLTRKSTSRSHIMTFTFADRKKLVLRGVVASSSYAADFSEKTVIYNMTDGGREIVTHALVKTINKTKSQKYLVTYFYADKSKLIKSGDPNSTTYASDYSSKTVTYTVDGEEETSTFNKTKTISKWDKNNIRNNNTYIYSDRSKTTGTSRLNNFVNWNAIGATFKIGNSDQTTVYIPVTENTNSGLVTSVGDFSELNDGAWYWEYKGGKHKYLGLSSASLDKTMIYNKVRRLDFSYLNDEILYFYDSKNTASTANRNGFLLVVDDDSLLHVAHGVWAFSTNCPIKGCANNFGNMNLYVGTGAFGYKTPNANIPGAGSRVFTGSAIGAYVDTAGVSYFTRSTFSATANYTNREVDISTSGTFARNLVTDVTAAKSSLNWSGSMNYAAGVNSMSGTGVTTSGISGDIKGNFFGGAATEIGGTWAFSGAGIEKYSGAFAGN